MMTNDAHDDLEFAAEEPAAVSRVAARPWKILVVDDEEDVHSITRMVLDGFEFEGGGLEFLSASSAEEGRNIMAANPDVAVMLLDVVMETPHAGLDLARQVREELGNPTVRIILRTGQPGQAPERQVILDYDINDYKSKSELTAQKLFTSVTTALRSCRDLRAIRRSRQGLEDIVAASADLFRASSLELFARGLLTQMTAMLRLEDSSMYLDASGFAARDGVVDFVIVAGTGDFEGMEARLASEVLVGSELELVRRAVQAGECRFGRSCFAGCFGQAGTGRHVLFLRLHREISELEMGLIQVFAGNVAVAYENLLLNLEMRQAHREVIFTLGEVVENRALIDGVHVHRVAEMAHLLAGKAGLHPDDCELLRLAMPMHDVGKVAIPDHVLLKSGPLDEAERRIMEQHPRLGYDILNRSANPIMRAAARIALEHQEAWDGSGYPGGLKEEDIHVFSRIARVVDVFDSLLSERVYKEAWTAEETLAHLRAQGGRMLDPTLVGLLLENWDEFLALRDGIVQQSRDLDVGADEKKS